MTTPSINELNAFIMQGLQFTEATMQNLDNAETVDVLFDCYRTLRQTFNETDVETSLTMAKLSLSVVGYTMHHQIADLNCLDTVVYYKKLLANGTVTESKIHPLYTITLMDNPPPSYQLLKTNRDYLPNIIIAQELDNDQILLLTFQKINYI